MPLLRLFAVQGRNGTALTSHGRFFSMTVRIWPRGGRVMVMPNVPKSRVPRGHRIPLSRFWLDWRISFFLLGVCLVVVVGAVITFQGGPETVPSMPGPSPVMHRERAQFYEGLGKMEEAIREYQAALHLSPRDPGLYQALALLFEKEGRFAEAIASYQRSLELEPESAKASAIRTRMEELRRRR